MCVYWLTNQSFVQLLQVLLVSLEKLLVTVLKHCVLLTEACLVLVKYKARARAVLNSEILRC